MTRLSFNYVDSSVEVLIPIGLYSRDAIFKCLYWYSEQYKYVISETENQSLIVSFIPKSESQKLDLEEFTTKFSEDLIDYELRLKVNAETKNIRELLIAKAFANGDLDDLE